MLFGCSLNEAFNELSKEIDKKKVERVIPKILSKIAEVKKQNQINPTGDGIERTSQSEMPPIPDVSQFYNVVLEDGSRNIYNISRIVEKYEGIKYSEACALVKRGNHVVAEHVSFDEASSLCVKLQNFGGVAMMQKYEDQTAESEKARMRTENEVVLYSIDVQELSTVSHIPIPKGITRIEAFCFSEFKYLESVDIPDTVTEIGSRAFEKCILLKKITIPDSVTEIGSGAFEGCANLEEIILSNSLTEIGHDAFIKCI